MALRKRDYTDKETLITAENLNEIQEAVIALEDGLFSVDNNKSGAVIPITDAAKRGFRSFNIYGKTTQDGTPSPETPVDLVSAGDSGSITVEVNRKNVLHVTATSRTMNGVTFTVNADKSILVNGTASEQTVFTVSASEIPLLGNFILSGCPKGGSGNTYSLVAAYHDLISSVWVNEEYDVGTGLMIAEDGTKKIKVSILVRKGVTVSNLVFYPMLRPAAVLDETYEPCVTQSMSIATPNDLLGIPVASGGNYTDSNGQQWVCDEIDFARGVYIQRIARKVFNGTEEGWWQTNGQRAFKNAWNGVNGGWLKNEAIASHFVCSAADAYIAVSGYFAIDNNGLCYFAYDKATLDEFKAWLADNNVTVLCPLASPIETPLSEEELAAYRELHTYKEQTTVSNDAGAWMELEYVMDAKKYFEGIAGGGAPAWLTSVTLLASAWTGSNSLYSQVVNIDGVTGYSKVDLLPSVEQLAIFHNKDVAFVTENDDGVVTVYAIGDKPTLDYTMQVSITEVEI